MELGQVTLLVDQTLILLKKGIGLYKVLGPLSGITMLPNKLKQCVSLSEFQTSIKSWKPDNCPCELCRTYVQGLGYVSLSD